jgi:hypothetical protein
MTMQQIRIVEDCNEAMRYFASMPRNRQDLVMRHEGWRGFQDVVAYAKAEFLQVQMLRDFIRFGR